MSDDFEKKIEINPDNQASFETSPEISETSFTPAPTESESVITEQPIEAAPAPVIENPVEPTMTEPAAAAIETESQLKVVKQKIDEDSKDLMKPGAAKNLLDILNDLQN